MSRLLGYVVLALLSPASSHVAGADPVIKDWNDVGADVTTADSPSTAVFKDRLYCVVRRTDGRLYSKSTADGSTWNQWTELNGNAVSNWAPSLAAYQGRLYCITHGNDTYSYSNSTADGITWTGWSRMSVNNNTLDGQNSLVFGDLLVTTGRGVSRPDSPIIVNEILVSTSADGATWKPWSIIDNRLSTLKSADAPGAAVFGDRYYAFMRGTDNRVYSRWTQKTDLAISNTSTNDSWTKWTELYGSALIKSAPSAAVYNDRLYCIVRGSDNQVYFNSSADGNSWGGWQQLPGMATSSAPSSVTFKNKLYTVIRGSANNGVYISQPIMQNLRESTVWRAGQILRPGDYLASANGQYHVMLQTDGNLCVSPGANPAAAGGKASWQTNQRSMPGAGNVAATLLNNGNLCVFDGFISQQNRGNVIWESATSGAQCYAVVENDGKFRIYSGSDPSEKGVLRWGSRAEGTSIPATFALTDPSVRRYLEPDGRLAEGQRLYSRNQNYYGVIEGFNFRVYKTGKTTGEWSIAFPGKVTSPPTAYVLTVSRDGFFRICPWVPVDTLLTNVLQLGETTVGRPTGPFCIIINDENGSGEIRIGSTPKKGLGIWEVFPTPPSAYVAARRAGYSFQNDPKNIAGQVIFGLLTSGSGDLSAFTSLW